MSKCEHGLTIKECYVCASPKYGEQSEKQDVELCSTESKETFDHPVAFASHGVVNWIADKQFQHEADLYTIPLNPVDSIKSSKTLDAQPQREWVGLTADEFLEITNSQLDKLSALCLVENKLKEKNT